MARILTMERWRALTYWPLMVASFVWLVAYSWAVIAAPGGGLGVALRTVMAVTWLVFAVDYFVRLAIASPRGAWFRTHLLDLAIVALPMLRPLRLLRVLTIVTTLHRTAGDVLRQRLAVYGASATLLLIYTGALAVLDAERGAPGANIQSFGDAVWWAFVTITTVGYGDFTPVTLGGRVIAVLMMMGGIAVVGVVTAALSSWIIERATRGHDDAEAATRGQIRALSLQIAQLAERIPDAPPSEEGTT